MNARTLRSAFPGALPKVFLSVALVAAALLSVTPHARAQSPSASAIALAGLPDTNRPWTGQDFAKAAELLGKRGVALPVSSDRRGGIIVQRMTALDNLAPLKKETPVAARLAESSRILSGASAILSLYVAAMTSKTQPATQSYSDELIRQMAFVLHAGAANIELTDEFQAAAPQDDKNPARAEALRKMRSGVTASFAGAASSLALRDYYSESELSILLDAMGTTLPRVKKVFDADSVRTLLANLEAHKALLKDPRDVLKVQAMIAELNQLDLTQAPVNDLPRSDPPRKR